MAIPSAPAVAVIRVELRVVERLYDVVARRRVIGTQADPLVVFDNSMGPVRRGDLVDEQGRVVERVRGAMTGVYQSLRITGADVGMRTFARARANPPSEVWIYMFTSRDADGASMSLAGEWWADAEGLRAVDLSAQAGRSTRFASGPVLSALHLEVRTLVREDGPHHWFLCSQYQLPWPRLTEMAATGKRLASRCHRLFDEMWTDARVEGGPPKSMWELGDALRDGRPLSFVVYVVDPLMEAVTRTVRYVAALDAWQAVTRVLAKDDEYRLAKRIEGIPRPHADLVAGPLDHYLLGKERESRRLLELVLAQHDDLMRWIGRSQKREHTTRELGGAMVLADTWYFGEGVAGASPRTKADDAWTSPFSAQVDDLNHEDTPDASFGGVGAVVTFVHARLGELADGQAFMRELVIAAEHDRLPESDGGAGLLFECRRKASATVAETVAGLMQNFAPAWVAAYRAEALPKLAALALKLKVFELGKKYAFKALRTKRWRARKTHRRLEAEGVEKLAEYYHLEVDVPSVRRLGMTQRALDRLMVGIELFNLHASLCAFAEERDPWAALGLLGSSIDAYSAVTKLYPRLERASVTLRGVTRTVEIAPVLSVLSSGIDVVLGARDAIASRNAAQRGGHVMRTMGAYLTIGGTVASASPWGAVMTIAGVALQSAGSWIAAVSDDLQVFLRHCRWGEPSRLDGVVAVFSDSNGFGYDGPLESLKNDVAAQLRALDWLMYRFDPSFEVFDGGPALSTSFLLLTMNPPRGLGPRSRWTVDLDVLAHGTSRVMKRYHWSSSEDADNVEISANEQLVVIDCPPPVLDGRQRMGARWGKVKVRGTIVLDVLGDGREHVTRRIDRDFDLPW